MKTPVSLFCLIVLFVLSACRYDPDPQSMEAMSDALVVQEVTDLLVTQEMDWNQGDKEAFMQGYWASDSLRFVSNGTVSYGWQATLDNYNRRYPSTALMGNLTFSEISVRPLSSEWATVFGRFSLERSEEGGGDLTGLFTLIVQRQASGWKVIQDHTSIQVNQS
ncbi:MAG: DUF4440 domain-containing protein [Rhodothermales bacterium]|nr:DUF4440 domain-containing protein [Rhodothermales bacterium]